ncbi:MAG: CHASE2 domain-containing protein [Bacteriovoracaceae bacterium]|nr:CHASE2 domain-containing protein [Bacteriovoracaceae bacterium]
MIILFQYSFSSLESIFYDLNVEFDLGISFRDDIVIITMDEESDEFLGESYPYTYATHERLLRKVTKDKPLVINYFINLPSPETNQSLSNLGKFQKTIEQYNQHGGHFRFATSMDNWGEQLPPKIIRDIGFSHAIINIDNSTFAKDDVSRRMILNISGYESIHLWTANTYREALGLGSLDEHVIQGSYYLPEADATFVQYRYYTSPLEDNRKVKRIPFHLAVVGSFPEGFFENKIVLVGSNYLSKSSDYVLTPFNKHKYKTSKLMLHAEMIESLIQNKTIYPLPKTVTYIFSIIVAIFLSLTISRVRPTKGLLITANILISILIVAFVLFSFLGVWSYITHLILTVFGVYYIWVPFRAIAEYQRRFAIQEETILLKKVEGLKRNFISLMSHDLKTPVAKIAGIADNMLQQHGESLVIRNNTQAIIESTKELNRFITSILDLTKIESSSLNLNKSSRDINSVIETVVGNLSYEAGAKKVAINTDLGPLYPIKIDINLMIRVISNLLENAIKYSGEGSTIRVKSWDDDQWIYIKIMDNGVGIKPDDLEHIFDKFYRVKNDASHSIKGTGLGLYLVKYFVELHGGNIVASSILGEGTSFKIKLKNE